MAEMTADCVVNDMVTNILNSLTDNTELCNRYLNSYNLGLSGSTVNDQFQRSLLECLPEKRRQLYTKLQNIRDFLTESEVGFQKISGQRTKRTSNDEIQHIAKTQDVALPFQISNIGQNDKEPQNKKSKKTSQANSDIVSPSLSPRQSPRTKTPESVSKTQFLVSPSTTPSPRQSTRAKKQTISQTSIDFDLETPVSPPRSNLQPRKTKSTSSQVLCSIRLPQHDVSTRRKSTRTVGISSNIPASSPTKREVGEFDVTGPVTRVSCRRSVAVVSLSPENRRKKKTPKRYIKSTKQPPKTLPLARKRVSTAIQNLSSPSRNAKLRKTTKSPKSPKRLSGTITSPQNATTQTSTSSNLPSVRRRVSSLIRQLPGTPASPAKPEGAKEQCMLCQSVVSVGNKVTHVWRAHVGSKPFECSHCRSAADYGMKARVEEHIRKSDHPGALVLDRREGLGYKYTEMAAKCFMPVMRTPDNVRTLCQVCNVNVSHIPIHLWTTHIEEKPFGCSKCEFKACYSSKKRMNDHIKSTHNNTGEFVDKREQLRDVYDREFAKCFPYTTSRVYKGK